MCKNVHNLVASSFPRGVEYIQNLNYGFMFHLEFKHHNFLFVITKNIVIDRVRMFMTFYIVYFL